MNIKNKYSISKVLIIVLSLFLPGKFVNAIPLYYSFEATITYCSSFCEQPGQEFSAGDTFNFVLSADVDAASITMNANYEEAIFETTYISGDLPFVTAGSSSNSYLYDDINGNNFGDLGFFDAIVFDHQNTPVGLVDDRPWSDKDWFLTEGESIWFGYIDPVGPPAAGLARLDSISDSYRVPEPATFVLFGMGLAIFGFFGLRKREK